MIIHENPEVLEKISHYSQPLGGKLIFLRQLIFETATEIANEEVLEETFKWGEPSYVTKKGSTIRINQHASSSSQYAMYFNCKTTLINTFNEIYGDTFQFTNNRAIVFNINEELAINELKHCISLSLTYHKIKHLPLLGV